jgi:outer membrane receptor protein involved in Fe transport
VQSNNTGNNVLNSPNFKVSITAQQTIPLGKWGTLEPRWDGAWTDVTYFDATEGLGIPNLQNKTFLPKDTIAQEAYWIHNLRLGYRFPSGNIELAAWVRNVEDKVYKNFAFDASNFNRTTINFVGTPRTYGGTVSLTY